LLNIVLFFQSTSLTMRRRFDNFQFISFAILPIALGVLISSIVSGSANSSFRTNTIALIMFFVFYIFIFPLYKLILNRTLALPKE
jgi:membrane protein YdbS with pleckstrin-like domain